MSAAPATPDPVRNPDPRRAVRRLADRQAGIVSRRQAYALGITRSQVRADVAARRWAKVGRQTLAVHTGPLGARSLEWIAVLEAGPRTVPSVAAVRAALWTPTLKQAALVLTMTVQQELATPRELGEAMLRVKRDRRRRFVHDVLLDLMGGVESLGELDMARESRERGLPEPARQVLRRGREGRYYLDVLWEEWGVVVEIDGIQHAWATHVVGDALRHNHLAIEGHLVLRLPLLGLRVAPDDFFGQIAAALRSRGWPGTSS